MSVNHVGADLELTCRVNACPVNVIFQWRALLDNFHGGISKNEQTVSRLEINNITIKQNIKVVCKAYCGKNYDQETSKIEVFCK